MGILEILTIIFVVLKVLGLITWSWWLVFAPLWAGYAVVLIAWALLVGAFSGLKR